MRSWTESLPEVFLHDNCEQISLIIFFAFLKKEEMRSRTHFTLQNIFLLFTVVVTKHVWPYFQSRFPKTSSERVSSCDSGGTDALSSVLQQADGQHKSIDDYMLYELAEARIAGAHCPKAMHILKQIVRVITMQFNFCKKMMDNVALKKILVNKATTFGVTVHISLLIINLEANMEYAQSHKWRREFRVSGQAIHKTDVV